MIRIVIIDDETPARDNIKQIISDNFSTVEIIGEADSVKSGIELLNTISPDVVLLDINLSDGSGFNLLENLTSINFKVIFVTAFDNYAIKAFKFNALDYLLKPINTEQLRDALEKAEKIVNKTYFTKEDLNIFLDNYAKKEEDRTIAIKEANKISYLALKDIIKLSADANYTTFHVEGGKEIVTSKSLKNYQELLPASLFFRIHKSYVINLAYVKEYRKEDGGYVVLKDSSRIGLSRRRKDEFLTIMAKRK